MILSQDARKNIDIFILFGGHSLENKLEEVFKNSGVYKYHFQLFIELYMKMQHRHHIISSMLIRTRGEFRT